MDRIRSLSKNGFLIGLIGFVLFTYYVGAILPPSRYKDRIKKSPTKVTAIIIDVKIIDKNKESITKKVKFKVINNYGEKSPGKTFIAYCKSAGPNPITGGTIYFYPKKGNKVFVTCSGMTTKENDNCGSITSLTTLYPALGKALLKDGFKGLDIGIGKVSPGKTQKINTNIEAGK